MPFNTDKASLSSLDCWCIKWGVDMKSHMKFAIRTAVLICLLGTIASANAQQEEHKQEGKPEQRQGRPAQQQRQAQPAARQQTRSAQPEQQRAQQGDAGRNHPQAPQTHAASGNRGNSEHGRISDEHYAASFGSEHSFHVNRGDYDSRRFAYGGYSFGFIDPWPGGWGYSDDVYVVYSDDGYYMYDRVHPGVRISINIL